MQPVEGLLNGPRPTDAPASWALGDSHWPQPPAGGDMVGKLGLIHDLMRGLEAMCARGAGW